MSAKRAYLPLLFLLQTPYRLPGGDSQQRQHNEYQDNRTAVAAIHRKRKYTSHEEHETHRQHHGLPFASRFIALSFYLGFPYHFRTQDTHLRQRTVERIGFGALDRIDDFQPLGHTSENGILAVEVGRTAQRRIACPQRVGGS